MKRPSFQFYPGDWLNDAGLRLCSVGARGLWIEMICLMHQGSDYGYLKVNHAPILPANLASISGATIVEVDGWLLELEKYGVFSKDEDGCIFSRRMISDEKVRAARAAGGILGGNPQLLNGSKGSSKVASKVNHQANLEPTPSSSSSSSSSNKKERSPKGSPGFDPKKIELPEWIEQSAWDLWCDARAEQKKPIGKIAAGQQIKKLEAYRLEGHSARSVIEHSVAGSFQGLYAPAKPKGATADADSREWFETRRGVEWKAGELGIAKWNEGEEQWPVYKQRVMQAEKNSRAPGITFDHLVTLAKKHEEARA